MPVQLDSILDFVSRASRCEIPIPNDQHLSAEAVQWIRGNDRLSSAEQIDIYRRQFFLRHVDSLREDYPALIAIVGEETFEAFAHAYLAAHPPDSFTLRDLGRYISAFAKQYSFDASTAQLAQDTIRYENTLIDVFDAADAAPITVERLEQLSKPETAHVLFHPSLRTLHLNYPIHELRRALKENESPCHPEKRDVYLALYRTQPMVQFEELTFIAYSLIQSLQHQPLELACQHVLTKLDPAEQVTLQEQFSQCFSRFTQLGWIVDVTLHENGMTREQLY